MKIEKKQNYKEVYTITNLYSENIVN